jgi:hypothetical protein
MKRRIIIKKGSLEHTALVKLKKEEGMNKIDGRIGRFVYIIYPMEGIKLVGSLHFDLYESYDDNQSEYVPLFEDVFNLELIIQEVEVEQTKVETIGQAKKQTVYRAMPHMFKLGKYLASESDVIIELDKDSGIYQVYLAMISNIQIANVLPKQHKDA